MARLTDAEIDTRLASLPGWSRQADAIVRGFTFEGFPEAVAFVGRLVPLAALAVAAVAMELAILPSAAWVAQLVGSNAVICLTAIPALAVAPLAAVLWILRSGAPASPALAGASIALNTSMIYLGQAIGTSLGGAVIAGSSYSTLPVVGAVVLLAALALSWRAERRNR